MTSHAYMYSVSVSELFECLQHCSAVHTLCVYHMATNIMYQSMTMTGGLQLVGQATTLHTSLYAVHCEFKPI